MAGKRSYDDGCAAAFALDLIGERWALLVVRELMFGPKRFSDLKADLRTITPNVLTQRLEDLEAAGIITRRRLPPPAASSVYELTPWGRALEPVLVELGRWGAQSPALPQGRPISAASVMLSLRTLFDPTIAGNAVLRLSLVLDGVPFGVRVNNGEFEVAAHQQESDADAEVVTKASILDSLLFNSADLNRAVAGKDVQLTGDRGAFEQFLSWFPLPVEDNTAAG
jgi:DNA-binding HxlR family transcriptional regulator